MPVYSSVGVYLSFQPMNKNISWENERFFLSISHEIKLFFDLCWQPPYIQVSLFREIRRLIELNI